MIKHYFVFAMAALVFASCNSPEEGNTADNAEVQVDSANAEIDNTAVSAEEDHHENMAEGEALTLNNGERWEINPEMKPHLKKGKMLVLGYLGEGATDYQTLAAELKEVDNKLIASCTMKGESHDELHKWLYPHLELVKQLSNAQNNEEATAIVKQLYESYETFERYFA